MSFNDSTQHLEIRIYYLLFLLSNSFTPLFSITDSFIKQTTGKQNKSGCVLSDKLRVEMHIPCSNVIYK